MVTSFLIILSVFLVSMVICCILTATRNKNSITPVLVRLYCAGMYGVVSYALFLLVGDMQAKTLFNGLYFSSSTLILLCLLDFVVKYTDTEIHTKLYRNVFTLCGVIEVISMVANTWAHHIFVLKKAFWQDTDLEYAALEFKTFEYLHLGFCYCLVGIILILLLIKTIKASQMYRRRYLLILIPLVVVIILNAICYTLNTPIDYSVLVYALYEFVIYFVTAYAAPKGLVEYTLKNVVEDFNSGIVCFDIKGSCVYANAKAYEIARVERTGDMSFFENYYKDWKLKNPKFIVELDYEQWEESRDRADGEHFFRVEYQRLKDSRNITTGHCFKLVDRTDEILRYREEQYLATHDRLTGLYNREYFFQKAEQILKRTPDVERYMVCTNIQNFKLINNLFGEEIGDRVLVDQASMLKFANYEDCIQGRIGADKFAMLISKDNFKEGMAIKNTGKLQYLIHDSNYQIQISIGVYKIEDPTESPQSMYNKANMAIESSKGDFQKNVVYYDKDMLEQLVHEKSVISEFDHALKTGQFKMYLQPLVDDQGSVIGAEALSRWIHPSQGLVMPLNYISIVEKSGMIIQLDEYMWDKAAQKLKEWKDRGIDDKFISVNISAKDFYYKNVYEVFTGLVEKYNINPANLNLEITETALMTDLDQHMVTLEKLQEYGFHIEIDDFGSGYSSLNMLKDIAADTLKIDMNFIRETENKTRSRIILNSVIAMARELGMYVISEGVETAEQLETLKNMGCDIFQGYYFSKPIPDVEFEKKYFGVFAENEK